MVTADGWDGYPCARAICVCSRRMATSKPGWLERSRTAFRYGLRARTQWRGVCVTMPDTGHVSACRSYWHMRIQPPRRICTVCTPLPGAISCSRYYCCSFDPTSYILSGGNMLWGPVANGKLSGAPLNYPRCTFAHCSAPYASTTQKNAHQNRQRDVAPYTVLQKLPVRVALWRWDNAAFVVVGWQRL